MDLFQTIAHDVFLLETPWPTIKGHVHMLQGRFQDGEVHLLVLHGLAAEPQISTMQYIKDMPACFQALQTHISTHRLRIDFIMTPEGVVWNKDADDAKTLNREMHLQALHWNSSTPPLAHFFHESTQHYLEQWRGKTESIEFPFDPNHLSHHQKLRIPHAPPLPPDLKGFDIALHRQEGLLFIVLKGIDMPAAMCAA